MRSRRSHSLGIHVSAPRGLVFNEDKTRIVHLNDRGGVDFLGFNVRRYRGKLLIKPSKVAVARIRARLTVEMKALRGHNAQRVLIRLNPIIRGWSAYYRHVDRRRAGTAKSLTWPDHGYSRACPDPRTGSQRWSRPPLSRRPLQQLVVCDAKMAGRPWGTK